MGTVRYFLEVALCLHIFAIINLIQCYYVKVFIFDILLLGLFLYYNYISHVEKVDILIKVLTSTSKYEEINLLYTFLCRHLVCAIQPVFVI